MQTIKSERLARDLETMMNVVNSDPGHIARSKAKAERVQQAKCLAAKKARTNANVTAAAGFCAGAIGLVSMLLALTMV